ncbi:MAG TPA: HlyD family efflux transporter periplasmic adaptor subunit [Polyangiaceae bacterium]|nr:HlyD family efflux transporter periplasmic adaptor subunit [Polyangiaceae bacterium]
MATNPYRLADEVSSLPALRAVRTPQPAVWLARALVALLAAVVVGLAVTPWQQTSTGAGRVIAYAPLERQQSIEAPLEGRITRWHVREGSRVRAGDPIVEITDNDPGLMQRLEAERDAVRDRKAAAERRAAALEGRIASLEESLKNATAAASRRTGMARDRLRAAEQAVEASAAAQKTAELNVERQRALFEQGLASKRAVELAELDIARTTTDYERARASLNAARGEELAFGADQAKVGSDGLAALEDARASRASALADVANAAAELTRVEVRLARQATQAVAAPRDGTVLRLAANQGGEMVKAGDPLALLVPDTDERAVELWVDGNDVPLIAEGRHVRLQFEGWPAVQFSGWPSVAVGTFGGRVALVDATDDGKGRFRVVVVPDGPEPWPTGRYLRQGVRAHGWVLLGRVRLGYELWRQFNGFPPAVGAAPDTAAQDKGDKK